MIAVTPPPRRRRGASTTRAGVAAAALLAACAEESNRAPVLEPVEDAQCVVNTPCDDIKLVASDPDHDPLEFTFEIEPQPPTQTQGAGGRPRLVQVAPGEARFSWTPGIADAGEGEMTYAVTFRVSDGRGGEDSTQISLRVVDEGVGHGVGLRFVEPPGAGMAVDLATSPCVDNLRVEVKADNIPDDEVVLEMAAPVPEGATLTPQSNAKVKLFNWCPTDAQLDASLSHSVTFVARRAGQDGAVTKRFLVRFKRNAGAGCPGAPPVIEHEPPGTLSGPLNYEIRATIRDDIGFKSPPVLLFSDAEDAIPADGTPPDTSTWQLVDFVSAGGDEWVATIPNRQLAEGEERTVAYVIIATDDDDPEGTRCDHTTESPPYTFVARGGSAGGQTYGFCSPCVADAQCGGEADRCVPLLGEFFCATSCQDTNCPAGQECVEADSVDGVRSYQCIPIDLNCGQLCTPDVFDVRADNGDVDRATPVEPGRHEDLTICEQDVDFYAVPVDAGESIRVRILFDHTRGDIDLAMQLPGDDGAAYQSLLGDADEEVVHEPCVPRAGDALVAVFPYQAARNTYTMVVEVGPGACDRTCEDDEFEAPPGNDTIHEFTPLETFPFVREGLRICHEDADHYGFVAEAGDVIRVGIAFSHREGDLQLRLWRSDERVVGESLTFRDAELVELVAPADDIYVAEVFGATRSVTNTYDLLIEKARVQACRATRECPPDQFCRDGACQPAACGAEGACGEGHRCAPPRAGLAPEAVGGQCVAACASDADCRQDAGYVCKRFEDFTTACAPAGIAGPGERCADFRQCAGDQVCVNFPGGYCATGGCAVDLPCADGTACVDLGVLTACLKRCTGDGDCRAGEGYTCQDLGGVRVCLP